MLNYMQLKKQQNDLKHYEILTHIWIFINSQNAIQSVENSTHFLANEIYATIEKLHSVQFHIHWISEHANISENEKVDQLLRSVFSSSVIARDRFLSFKHLNAQITEQSHQRWLNLWKNNSKKDKHYEKFETKSNDSKIQFLSKKFTKHVTSTIMQFKLEHDHSNHIWFEYQTTTRKSAMKIAI
jgi:hypothetical protein